MTRQERIRTTVVFAVFAAVFIALSTSAYRDNSATSDEPISLTAGYTMLRLGDYRIHPDNMPLLRMWAALPLLAMPQVTMDTNAPAWKDRQRLQFSHDFLYVQNDADRLLNRARFMNVLLGIALGCLLFFWAREWFGFAPAVIVLALFATEPNILAHSGVVTTDMGVSCLVFGALYFAWRLSVRWCATNLLGLAAFFTLAIVSKFTALLLAPVLLVLLRIPQDPAQQTPHRILRAAGVMALLLMLAYAAIWAVYGFRYAPTADGQPFDFTGNPWVLGRAPALASALRWVDSHRLLPNACTQGLLLEQARGQQWTAYLWGKFSERGWWYYFPAVFVMKTPVALLLLLLLGVVALLRNLRTQWRRDIFVLLPLATGWAVAMLSHLNVGVRHLLPLFPLMLLVVGGAVAGLLACSRTSWLVLVALCLGQFAELAAVHPHELSFVNYAFGGPRQGWRFLADSNLDWGQDLKRLKRWMDAHHVSRINLSYAGSADPAYYGIACTWLPQPPYFVHEQVMGPELPGYVAVSAHYLTGAGLRGNQFYAPLRSRQPATVIGDSIYVYWVDRPWW